jgi:hypothetical protein
VPSGSAVAVGNHRRASGAGGDRAEPAAVGGQHIDDVGSAGDDQAASRRAGHGAGTLLFADDGDRGVENVPTPWSLNSVTNGPRTIVHSPKNPASRAASWAVPTASKTAHCAVDRYAALPNTELAEAGDPVARLSAIAPRRRDTQTDPAPLFHFISYSFTLRVDACCRRSSP